MTMDTYGPQLGGLVKITAPGRICDGVVGWVMSLHLATNEATVQAIRGGTQYIISWDAAFAQLGTLQHGTRSRYKSGCSCHECAAANAAYTRAYRVEQKRMEKERQKEAS